MRHRKVAFAFACLLILMFSFAAVRGDTAQGSQLTLLGEQHWETYGVGGTCSYGHNLFLKDLNGDGVSEIITGGITYWVVNGSNTPSSVPLKVWSWNGKNFTLDASHVWNGTGGSRSSACVYAADVYGNGGNEILTGGAMSNGSIGYAELAIWNWTGSSLVLDAHAEWSGTQGARVNSISVSDLDKDGKPEIITGGATSNDTTTSAQLRIWHINGNSLSLLKSVEWCANKTASVNSVCVNDVDGDGIPEIVSGGYDHDLQNSTGQLRLWKWNGASLTMEDDEEWQTSQGYILNIAGGVQGNTVVNTLGVGDIDGNGQPDVVTGGFTYDGIYCDAQVVVWKWNGAGLAEAGSTDWHTQDINEVKSISINDVDGDGKQEIVASGVVAASGSFGSGTPEMAQLRVWGWDGKTFTLKASQDWTIGQGVCAWSVDTGNLNKNGGTEIVTLGCMYVGTLCDPDMRIWAISRQPAPLPLAFLAAMSLVAITAVTATFLLMRKKRPPVFNIEK